MWQLCRAKTKGVADTYAASCSMALQKMVSSVK
jgi:hypothetical protein